MRSANSNEMIAACHRISKNLQKHDGIERDARLPCNHYGHWPISRIDKVMEMIRDVKTEATTSINSMEQKQAAILNYTT